MRLLLSFALIACFAIPADAGIFRHRKCGKRCGVVAKVKNIVCPCNK